MLTHIITIVLLAIYAADLVRTLPRIGKPRTGLAGRIVGQPITHLAFAGLFILAGALMATGQLAPAPRYAGWVLIVGGSVHAVASVIAMIRKPQAVGPIRIKSDR